jgi:hypothetical protein
MLWCVSAVARVWLRMLEWLEPANSIELALDFGDDDKACDENNTNHRAVVKASKRARKV